MPCGACVCRSGKRVVLQACRRGVPDGDGKGFQRCVSLFKEPIVDPLLLILVVILILSVLGGGYGFRRGNTLLGAGGGLLGTILLIVLILVLLGRIRL